MSYTKGPWWASIDPAKQPVPYYRGLVATISSNPPISVVTGVHGDTSGPTCESDEWVHNSRLIAAAPDLYEALKPFAALADEIERLSEGTNTKKENWCKACTWDDLARARSALSRAADPPAQQIVSPSEPAGPAREVAA